MTITLNGTTGITTPDVNSDGLTVDSTTLVVDEANNRVGIGTSSPEAKTSIVSDAGAIGLTVKDANAGASNYFSVQYNGTTGVADLKAQSTGGSTAVAFSTSLSGTTAERMRIDSDGRVTMPYQPAFYVYGSGTQSWSGTSAYQILQLNVATSLGSRVTGYNTSTYTFTAPVAGTYVFFGRITQTGSATGPSLSLFKNSVTPLNEMTIGYYTAYMTNGSLQLVQLAAGDAVTLRVVNNNSTSFSLDLNRCAFAGWLLG